MILIDKKLLLFGGKGGTGKTSCAAATSIYAASKGKKTLIISTDPAHSLSDSFEKQIGSKAVNIKPNLDALEIDANLLLKEYQNKYGNLIKQIADEGTFLSKEDIGEFFDLSLPGIDELMALIKVIDILEEDKYGLIILDTAPTGHTLRLLEMPKLMTTYVKVLAEMRQKHKVMISMVTRRYVKDKADEFIDKMYNDVEKVKKVLQDATKTKFIPVTIPEAMSVYETRRLLNSLENSKIPIGIILVNKIIPNNCGFCNLKRKEQEKYIKEIKKNKYKIKEIPLFPNEIKGKNLETLSGIIHENKNEISKLKTTNLKLKEKFDIFNVNSNLEFLLLGGKGGTGKSSMASAIALQESKNKKVLILSTDPAHSLSDCFGIKIGDNLTKINSNLTALELNPSKSFNNLKLRYKKEINNFFNSAFKTRDRSTTIDAPFDRKIIADLFDLAPPGIDEIMALKSIIDLMKEKKYNLIILDTAPTGHTLRLLEMPELAESWAKVLLNVEEKYPFSLNIGDTLNSMVGALNEIKKILSNSKKTEFVTVTIPEAMSLSETKDLIHNLKKLEVLTQYLIINEIFPENECDFCTAKRSEQVYYITELKKLKLKTIGIELFDKEIQGNDQLMKLSKKLYKTS